jgi:peptidylprolyl isomerase
MKIMLSNRNIAIFIAILAIVVLMAAYPRLTGGAAAKEADNAAVTRVLLETTMGNITLELFKDMPITAGNFESLVKQHFYDGTVFHRVIKDFMIQGGDPEGTGMGGPGYSIKDEFNGNYSNVRGTIAMANAGPNTGGSQFFISVADNSYLDPKHPVFGKVVSGVEVVDAISNVHTDSNDRPLQEVRIIKARVIE